MICDRPIMTGPVCEGCAELDIWAEDDEDSWAGMTRMERADFAELAIENGNLKDAITFIMHDGDVRADSVRLVLDLIYRHVLNNPTRANDTLTYINRLDRLITAWETT
jgi:hypothetical protein